MRLLKTGTYSPESKNIELIQRWGSKIPPYAILSHTWSENADDEVLLADVQNGTLHEKPACEKLLMVLKLANLDGYDWLWCDTCCIDKSSSVELSEDINSMFKYYKNATKCYAYLAGGPIEDPWDDSDDRSWWRRGWTLQELLAPTRVAFYSGDWTFLGTRDSLRDKIFQATGIDKDYLADPAVSIHEASIAKRMSWVAKRVTGREEDIAYSLLGLFDVNMSLLYGEGAKEAFVRLQEEIMKRNEDQSLFAWTARNGNQDMIDDCHGLLADSPKDFEHSGNIRSYNTKNTEFNPAIMTARGLRISLPLAARTHDTFIAVLQCFPAQDMGKWFAVGLRRLGVGINGFARVQCSRLMLVSELGESQEIYIRQVIPSLTMQAVYPYHFFQIRSVPSPREKEPERAKFIRIVNDIRLHTTDEDYRLVSNTRSRPAPEYPFPTPPVSYTKPRPFSQRWTEESRYNIYRSAGSLSGAVLIGWTRSGESSGNYVLTTLDADCFILLVGTTAQSDIGFEVRSLKCTSQIYLSTLQEMKCSFFPQPAGTLMELEHHSVLVTVVEQIDAGHKVYLIDVIVQALPRPSTVTEASQVTSTQATPLVSNPEEESGNAEEESGDSEEGDRNAEEGDRNAEQEGSGKAIRHATRHSAVVTKDSIETAPRYLRTEGRKRRRILYDDFIHGR